MSKVIKKQQAAQPCKGLESLTKQDISDPTTSYSVALTNIPLVALSSLHGVYAQSQIQINNNPISDQSRAQDVHSPVDRVGRRRPRTRIFFITLAHAAADDFTDGRFNSARGLLLRRSWRSQQPMPSRGSGAYPEDNSPSGERAPQWDI